MTDKVQQDFEDHIKSIYDGHLVSLNKEYGYYTSDMLEHMWEGWKHAHKKYSQDSQKYIDLLRDIYYNYEVGGDMDKKIEKLLGDFL